MKKFLFSLFIFSLPVAGFSQEKTGTKTDVTVSPQLTDAAAIADSVAKAELKNYQKEHPGRLTKFQLSLLHYDRTLNTDIKGGNGYYMFDYDYNQDLGGLVYLIHFSVIVNTKTGRTVFKAQ